jgi:DtxR family Mn-dependent transcriptional regulator
MTDLHYSESVEMYLKTLANLGGGAEAVPIARIAERLDVSPVSANEMMQRLGRDDLVAHQPYRGVQLTAAGRQLAHDVIRRERLWERFLHDTLGLDWARVHEWACQLEHATAPAVIEALDAYLGYPDTCPQGNPIPRRPGDAEAADGRLLSELGVGQSARILAFEDETAEVLSYLHKRGLAPGVVVSVTEIAPKHGPLTVRGPEGEHVLGTNLAATVRVARLEAVSDKGGGA